MSRRLLVAAALTFALGGSACSPADAPRVGGVTKEGAAEQKDNQFAFPPKDEGDRKALEAAKKSPSPSPLPEVSTGPDGKPDVPSYVKVEVPEHESWGGETCVPPRRGSRCLIPFHGAAGSKVEGAKLYFLAYENGSPVEATSTSLDFPKGSARVMHELDYTIGPATTFVTFKVELRDKDGNVLAANRPQSYPIAQ